MADLGGTLQGHNLHHRGCKEVVDQDGLLVLLDECYRCGWRNVVKGAVSDRCTRFCRDVISREHVQALGGGVRDDTRCWRTEAVFNIAPYNSRTFSWHAPNFNPLRRCLVWTKHEQVTLILKCLVTFLGNLWGPRVGGVRMNGLHDEVDRAINAQRLWKVDGVRVGAAARDKGRVNICFVEE